MRILSLILSLLFLLFAPAMAQTNSFGLKPPPAHEVEENLPSQIELSSIPFFPSKLDKNLANIAVNSRLKLALDDFFDIKKISRGDYFKAHVLEDFYIGEANLILPKHSWVRGRIHFVKKPTIFNKSISLGVHLDQLVTPLGDTVGVDAYLNLQKGILNADGILQPVNNALADGLDKNLIIELKLKSLDLKSVGSILNGTLVGLFAENSGQTFYKGQEIQVIVKRSIRILHDQSQRTTDLRY